MRIMALSDSHGSSSAIRNAISQHAKDIDTVIFLGDGLREFENVKKDYPHLKFYSVTGNCDTDITAKTFDEIKICGTVIFFTHGHYYNVKSGTSALVSAAKNAGAQIALYGHTHIPDISFSSGITVVNPGSVARSRNGENTYCIIELQRGKPPYPTIFTL